MKPTYRVRICLSVLMLASSAECKDVKYGENGLRFTAKEAQISRAIENRDFDSAKKVLAEHATEKGSKENLSNLLLHTFHAKNLEAFEFLLNNGVSPNIKGPTGRELIFDLVIANIPDIGMPESGNDVRYLQSALSHGANPNTLDAKTGETPLIVAINRGEYVHVEALLKFGAKPNTRDKTNGDTPIMRSAILNRYDITWLLIQNGGDYKATAPGSFGLMEILEKSRYTRVKGKPNEKVLARQKIIAHIRKQHPNFKPFEER